MDERDARPPYRLGALTALAVFGLYLLTLAPTVQYWDAPEYMAAAHSFGIPHPPGNPLFVLMAHVWGLLPLAADYGKDRKSTRLNSSHMSISYAVFCLKKK